MAHLEILPVIDPNQHEIAALEHAGCCGGEYLESIGKTDLAALDVDEWSQFVDCVVTGYQDKLQQIMAEVSGSIRRVSC